MPVPERSTQISHRPVEGSPLVETGSRTEQIIVLGSVMGGLDRVTHMLGAVIADDRPIVVTPVQYINGIDDAFRDNPRRQEPHTLGVVLLPEVRYEDEAGTLKTLFTDDSRIESTVGMMMDRMGQERNTPVVRLGYDVTPQDVGEAFDAIVNPPAPQQT